MQKISTEPEDDGIIRNFTVKYAIIYANEHYDKLRALEPGMGDLKWTKNDLRCRDLLAKLGKGAIFTHLETGDKQKK